jgi:hypothetical protein
MRKLLISTAIALAFSHNAIAADGIIGPVQIEQLTIVATAIGSHIPGNMEIKIRNGFTLPSGVNCDKFYITTRKTTDPDRAMFFMFLKVQETTQAITLYITDNPALTAYPGRCSLEAVILQ